VLDASKIEMLGNLPLHDSNAIGTCRLQTVETFWERPVMTNDSYRGLREIPVDMLVAMYQWLENEPLAELHVDSRSS
jgi:hypothetical protein